MAAVGELTPGAVSVVIPTKDRARVLTQTLRSVWEQTFSPDQVVIADDGSTDETEEIARAAGAVYLFKPGGGWGVTGGRNAGLEQVTTEYVAFVDSDDLLRPRALELMRQALELRPQAPFAYGRALSAAREGDRWCPQALTGPEPGELVRPLCSLFGRNSVHSSCAVARTSGVRSVGAYDPSVRFAEDHHLWVRLARRGAPAHCAEVLSVYRHHPGNIFAPADMIGDRDAFRALADADPRLARCWQDWLGVHLLETVAETARSGRPADVARSLSAHLLHESRWPRITAAAIEHFRRRRRLWQAGLELWAGDPDFRAWLAGYE